MDYQILTEALKYLGLIVGTASSIWGALTELKREGPDGRKRLTKPGKISIAITVLSFVVSLTSAAVGDKLARQADKNAEFERQAVSAAEVRHHQELISRQLELLTLGEKSREEQQQRFDKLARQEARATKDVLISGQSLRDISLTWNFPHAGSIASDLFKQFESDVDDLDEEWGRDPHQDEYYAELYRLNYKDVVRSLVLRLGGTNSDDESCLALFALDDGASVVLPVGFLEANQLRSQKDPLIRVSDLDVAAGVEVSGEGSPDHKRQFTSPLSLPGVSRSGSAVKLEWHITGMDSVRAIDKSDSSLIPVLPQEIRVMVLTNVEILPVNPSRTSDLTYRWNIWAPNAVDPRKDLAPAPLRGSLLRIIPNGINHMAAMYEMRLVSLIPIQPPEEGRFYCFAAIWKGVLIPSAIR